MVKNYSKLIVGGSVGLIVVAGGIMYAVSKHQAVKYETATIGRGDVVEQVSVTGSIAPRSKVRLEPEASGQVDAIKVKEGDEVKVGDDLITIDAADINARVQAQRAAVNSAVAKLRELEAGATAEELALKQSAVETAQSRLDAAIAAKADAETGYDNADRNYANVVAKADTLLASKIDAAQLTFEEAATGATDAITRLSNPLFTTDTQLSFTSTDAMAETEALHTRLDAKSASTRIGNTVAAVDGDSADAAAILTASASITLDLTAIKSHLEADVDVLEHAAGLSSTTLSTYQSNINTALSNVNTYISKLSADKSALQLQQKLNDADVTAADIALSNASAAQTSATFAVETAQKALEQAMADLDLLKAGTRKETVDSQRAQVDLQQATLNGLLNDLSKRTITAPIDGIVTDISVEIGDMVQPGEAVVVLNTVGNFEIKANISEVDIAKVTVNEPVSITLDAFSKDEVWQGKVIAIQPAENVVEGIIFYETTVMFTTDDQRLRSGMTANLDIETGRAENVLMVPFRAVKEHDNKTFVDVLINDVPVETEITLGLENENFYEVTSGLNEGDVVVVSQTSG